ncbi:MAG: histidine kinase [Hydrogenophaga sp.]|uniref:sensor histidine kinase n=1 Tax=Hydrogenophaga sp. TaxID=1904254 RepID=UPI0027331AB1|nr:histidine kinase [Hydrogenophaga sp.]MDP3626137.1 histidine kinase [Hydrogenophaga sp.]MDZ4293819.1 histidine kinase [Hydrogenophaga sp.]
MTSSALNTSFDRSPPGELTRALHKRLALLKEIIRGRSPSRTVLWAVGGISKAVIAALTVVFVLVTVELPMLLVATMFALPAAGAVAITWIRAACSRRAVQRAATERARRLECEQERALAEARLALLSSQFDPDFLFNNLASLQFLMKKDPAQANFMLFQLVQFLRLSAPFMRCNNSTLGTQMELVDAFLQLAAIRMGKRVFVHVSCPPELKGVPFPPMVIHALVENALLHGAEPCLTPVMVQVRAYEMSGRLVVDVQDDGVGLGHTQSKAGGRGLRNVRTRLERVYGTRAHLTVVEQPARGVLSRVEILQGTKGTHGPLGEPCDAQA